MVVITTGILTQIAWIMKLEQESVFTVSSGEFFRYLYKRERKKDTTTKNGCKEDVKKNVSTTTATTTTKTTTTIYIFQHQLPPFTYPLGIPVCAK